jgi:ArsR family transcriptional regulator
MAMDEIEELAEIFKALSDPTRLRLVKLLSECAPSAHPVGEYPQNECKGGPLCVNALAHELGVSQSATSQHLRVLRQAGLVRGERRGPFVHYSLNKDGLKKYKAALLDTLGENFAVG